jgi:hypothetical protein
MSDDRTEHLRAFLLGYLDEAAAAEVEARVFEDDDEAELVAAVEAELYDAYALGELSAEDRGRLEARGLTTPEGRRRLGMARALATTSAREASAVHTEASARVTEASTRPNDPGAARVAARAPEAPSWLDRLGAWLSPPRVALGLALAAALVLFLRPSTDPAPTTLVPDAVRSAGDPARASLHGEALRLELDLDGEAPRASYRVVLLARGAERWRSADLVARGPALPVLIPTAGLEPGVHTLRLEADGELVATYTLELAR